MVLAGMAGSGLVSGSDARISRADAGVDPLVWLAQKQAKPPRGGGMRPRGDDSCRWANDLECDDPDIGTGACTQGTDYSDCRYLREGEADACRWANDGECDEPGLGTGVCVQGSDLTDCRGVAPLRFRTDACQTAFNGICEEPGQGDGSCRARTDRRDCMGAERPLTINDHFFGRDDRVILDHRAYPWNVVGEIEIDGGGQCTATLIGEDVLITAAHCISSEQGLNARGRFVTAIGADGGPYEAQITHYLIDPRFDYQRFTSGNEIDGTDWALLRIDRPLGRTLGYHSVHDLSSEGEAVALATPLDQGGYSWDTGEHLSGNLGCRIRTLYPDDTFAHECDTTRGDSGSPFLIRRGQGYAVIGVDSNFRSVESGPPDYIAVSASAFARHVADFIAGRTGVSVSGPARRAGSKRAA